MSAVVSSLEYVRLYDEINVFCLIILLIILLLTRYEGSDSDASRTNARALLATCAFIVSDSLCFTMTQNVLPKSAFWLMVLKSAYFLSTTVMCYFWFLYFEMRQGVKGARMRRVRLGALSLVVLHLLLLVLNASHGFFFYVDADLRYLRGPLFATQYLLSYSYVVLCCGTALVRGLRARSFEGRDQFLTLALFPIPPAICGVIQYFDPNLPCACCGMALSALIMFLHTLLRLISRDPLTGLHNRRRMLRDIDAALRNSTDEGSLWVVMCDLDHFKEINDRLGHAAGDRALELAARALERTAKAADGQASAYRFGGDEFVMLVSADSDREVEAIRDSVRGFLAQECAADGSGSALEMSLGFVANSASSTTRSMLEAADRAMYEDKMSRRAARSARQIT